jgi:hypothetical protein
MAITPLEEFMGAAHVLSAHSNPSAPMGSGVSGSGQSNPEALPGTGVSDVSLRAWGKIGFTLRCGSREGLWKDQPGQGISPVHSQGDRKSTNRMGFIMYCI